MAATIIDVARRAGVSMKTVSRVMNNETAVAKDTRAKVTAAALELNYTPNRAARGLAGSKSYLIAMLYDIPSPGYTIKLQKGANQACREYGYYLVVEPLDTSKPDMTSEVSKLMSRLNVDGVILAPPLCDNEEVVELLQNKGTPFIPIAPSQDLDDVPVVKMDDKGAAAELTNYLIAQGHKNIGFVKGHSKHSASELRFAGFKSAMSDADLSIYAEWIEDGDFTYKSGVEAGVKILSGLNRPTAIFASNDDAAAGVMAAAGRLGLKVPEDLSVVGFDDTPIASSVWPRLTTIRQPVSEMGYQAAKLLLSKNSPNSELVHSLPHALIERESAGKISQ